MFVLRQGALNPSPLLFSFLLLFLSLLATYFGSQVISASDGMDGLKADSEFYEQTFAGQVLSN